MTASRAIFERLAAGGSAAVLALHSSRDPETDFVEFKLSNSSAQDLANRNLSHDDRKNLAKCLSGFANSGGGTVIWGLPDPKPNVGWGSGLSDAKALQNVIRLLIPEVAEPHVRGVELEEIPGPPPSGPALMMYVPPRTGMPIMATAKNQQRYYLRAGHQFQHIRPEILSAMFGAGSVPDLHPAFDPAPGGTLSNEDARRGLIWVTFGVVVQNDGAGYADDPYLHVEHSGWSTVEIRASAHATYLQTMSGRQTIAVSPNLPIPPAGRTPACTITVRLELGALKPGPPVLRLTVGARVGLPARFEIGPHAGWEEVARQLLVRRAPPLEIFATLFPGSGGG